MDFKELKKAVKKNGIEYAKLLLVTVEKSKEAYPFRDGKTKEECVELINSVIRAWEQDAELKKWGLR